jgi:hypothetical protein
LTVAGGTNNGIVTFLTSGPSLSVNTNLTFDATAIVPNVTLTGSLYVSGGISASAYHIYSNGTPSIQSATNLNLAAGTRVSVTTSPFKLASFTDTQTGSLTPSNGDMIYNSTSNKFWGYAGGAWVALH